MDWNSALGERSHPVELTRQSIEHGPGKNASRRSSTREHTPALAETAKRRDIQGLRTVAVALVFADHLADKPSGGFIGVDVFFVISGFLISGLLLREYERRASISFVNFYRRRILRIIPGAVVVLLATCIAAHIVFLTSRAKSTYVDAWWSTAFMANWHFAANGTDYFQQTVAQSPLQHYWSLAVEEQFYIVWPWVLLGVLWASRRLVKRNVAAGGLACAITAASLAWALHQSTHSPTIAYFSTFTRAWELGLGAVLAVLGPRIPQMSSWLRAVGALLGLAVIGYGAVTITATSTFPAPWALVPTLGTVLVIAAGCGAANTRYNPLLANRVTDHFGQLSYSIYLWHWPVIVVAQSLTPERGARYYGGIVVVALLSAELAYYAIERPIHHSNLLSRDRAAPRRRRARLQQRWAVGAATSVILAAIAVPLGLALSAYDQPPAKSAADIAGSQYVVPSAAPGAVAALPPPVTQAQLARALKAKKWPDLDLTDSKSLVAPDLLNGCFNNFEAISRSCRYNADPDNKNSAVLIGDSIGMSWVPSLRSALPDWTLTAYGKFACPWIDATVRTSSTVSYTSCLAFHKRIYANLATLKPNVIFVSNAEYEISVLSDNSRGQAAEAEWGAAMKSTLAKLEATGAKVIVLSPPPAIRSIATCATKFNAPKDCNGTVATDWHSTFTVTAKAVAGDRSASQLDTHLWFCVDQTCPAILGSVPIRADGVHITRYYAARIAANMRHDLQVSYPTVFKRP